MSYVTCPRCGSRRLVQSKCFDCWWRPQRDWFDGHMTPLNTNIEYERADGSCWMWAQRADGTWFREVTREASQALAAVGKRTAHDVRTSTRD